MDRVLAAAPFVVLHAIQYETAGSGFLSVLKSTFVLWLKMALARPSSSASESISLDRLRASFSCLPITFWIVRRADGREKKKRRYTKSYTKPTRHFRYIWEEMLCVYRRELTINARRVWRARRAWLWRLVIYSLSFYIYIWATGPWFPSTDR